MRTCKKCGVEKEDELFPISRGYRENECRECRKIYLNGYYRKNREKLLLDCKKYYEENHEKCRESHKSYYERHKEEILKRMSTEEYLKKSREWKRRWARKKGIPERGSTEYKEILKNRPQCNQKGELNRQWKGGRLKNYAGYITIYKPNHPSAIHNQVLEHRLVVEEKIGRYLRADELVHHIDGNRANNNINNLKIMTWQEHSDLHYSMKEKKPHQYCKKNIKKLSYDTIRS